MVSEEKKENLQLIAKGNTAEVFLYDESKILKLFMKKYPKASVEHEFDNARMVSECGIKTPKAYSIEIIDGRYGIIYDLIQGENLYAQIWSSKASEREIWLRKFAEFQKNYLKHVISDAMDFKDFLKMFAGDDRETISKINSLEDGNQLLHGDFHPGNVMVGKNEELVMIDMMNVCKGPAAYDIARTYFLFGEEKLIKDKYLEFMDCRIEEIKPFLEVIALIRKAELG